MGARLNDGLRLLHAININGFLTARVYCFDRGPYRMLNDISLLGSVIVLASSISNQISPLTSPMLQKQSCSSSYIKIQASA